MVVAFVLLPPTLFISTIFVFGFTCLILSCIICDTQKLHSFTFSRGGGWVSHFWLRDQRERHFARRWSALRQQHKIRFGQQAPTASSLRTDARCHGNATFVPISRLLLGKWGRAVTCVDSIVLSCQPFASLPYAPAMYPFHYVWIVGGAPSFPQLLCLPIERALREPHVHFL